MKNDYENELYQERVRTAIIIHRWLLFLLIVFAIIITITQFIEISSLNGIREDRNKDQQSIISNSAKVDAAIAQMLVYQQQTVQYWDELSKRNPKIDVPKATVTAPGDKKHLTDEDLRRPTPTPTPTPKVIVKYKRKPTPTPHPFKWPWQH